MGYLYAFITSLFFTAYTLPKKLSRQTTARYSLFQAIGFFGGCLITYIIHCILAGDQAEALDDVRLIYSGLAGVTWFFGCVFFFMGIDEMGLSRANQWKNLQGPFGAVFNLLFLAEYLQTNVWFILLSSVFILISAMFLTVREEGRNSFSRKGIIYALLAAVLFGLNSMLLKHGTNSGFVYSQQLVLSGMVLISSLVYLPLREKSFIRIRDFARKDNLLGILGGIIYFGALTFSIRSYSILPGSVTFTIIQLNSVWTVLAGVFIFHEIDFRQHWKRIAAGIVCALAGVVLLLYA